MDLGLLGIAGPNHRFFDESGGIFANFDARPCRDHQDDPARLPELEGRLRVLVDEHLLHRRSFGSIIAQDGFKLRSQMGKALGQAFGRVGLQLSVGDVRDAVSFGLDQSPARRPEPGVEAQYDQASFSSSASLIS